MERHKNGGWSGTQDGKGGNWNAMQDGNGAQSSGWWDAPGDAATMPESQGGQQGKGKQRDLLSSMAPWNQGKGMQQQTMMPQANSGAEMNQQGMTGPPPSTWQKIPQQVMVMPQSHGGQQQGNMAQTAPWQENNAMQQQKMGPGTADSMMGQPEYGQSEMFRAQQAWPNQSFNGNQQMIAEAYAHESVGKMKPPGSPPNHINFDLRNGPATWLIGQWHPKGWNESTLQVSSWYLVEKGDACMWPHPDGTPKLAVHYHPEMAKNFEYRDESQHHQGKGYTRGTNAWDAWNGGNNDAKGNYQKGK
jgi:hypothetical protein